MYHGFPISRLTIHLKAIAWLQGFTFYAAHGPMMKNDMKQNHTYNLYSNVKICYNHVLLIPV